MNSDLYKINENQRKPIEFLSELLHKNGYSDFNGHELILSTEDVIFGEVKQKLDDLGISYQESISSSFIIDLRKSNLKIKTYLDKDHFLKDFELTRLKEDFAILFFENSYLYYSTADKSFITGNVTKNKNYKSTQANCFVDNTVSYLKLKEKLSLIADYKNTAGNEYVFYTSTKGIYKLNYPDKSPDFPIEIKNQVEDLLFKLDSPYFKLFFINELFDFLKVSQEPIKTLILDIKSIVSSAERNHQLYIKNFSFEKFRNKLQYEKTQYFNSIREILGKVLTQLISIPISILTVFLTVYKTKIGDIFPLLIILIGYSVYLFYFIKFQSIYLSDIKEIKNDFKEDFKKIKNNSGLQLIEIEKEEKKIIRRILNIKTIIITLIISKSILSLVLVIYILCQIK